MRKSRVVLVAVVIMAIAFSPFLLGFWVERNYRQLIGFYNSQGNFSIEIKSYDKAWISAHATLAVKSVHLPQTLQFAVSQDIHYGPLVFTRRSLKFILIELAFIHSEITTVPEADNILTSASGKKNMMLIDDDVSFSGKHRLHFASQGFKLDFGALQKSLEFGNFSGNIAITPSTRKVKGKMSAADFSLDTPEFSLAVSKLYLRFNQQLSGDSLWLGDNRLSFAEATIEDPNGRMLVLINLNTSGILQQHQGALNLERKLSLVQLKISNQQIGPLDLMIYGHDLSAEAMTKIFAAYKKIPHAENKMEILQQLLFQIPNLITENSRIDLNNLQLDTADGRLQVSGNVDWSKASLATLHSIKEVVNQAHAQASVRVATALADDMIQAAADLTYLQQRMADPHKPYLSFQQSPAILAKQSAMEIAILTQDDQLPKDVGIKLLALQRADTSETDYAAELANLAVAKKITPAVQATLLSQYHQLKFAGLSTPEKFAYLEDEFHHTFDGWVKSGFISQDKEDYVATVNYQQGKVQLNGNLLTQ